MRLERIEIQGFRSFRDLCTFDLSKSPGVVRLGGRNDDEPALGANGAGKSSLWEAVYWVLTGKTSTGLKGPEVATWNQGRGVYGLVRIAGRTLVRTWGTRNTLVLDGEDVTQNDVNEWMGLTPEQLLCCSYMAQHAPAFLDMSASEKTDLIASVLNLDAWGSRAEQVRQMLARVNEDKRAVEQDLARVEGQEKALRATDYEELSRTWQREKEERYNAAADVWAAAAQSVREAKERYEKEPWKDAALEGELSRRVSEREACEKMLTLATLWLEKQRDRKAAVRDGDCPTCGRPLSASHKEHLPDIEEKLERAREEYQDAKQALQRAKDLESELRSRQSALVRLRDTLEREVEDASKSHAEALDRLSAARAEKNPYGSLIEEKESKMRALRARRESLLAEQEVLEAHAKRVEFWITGFRDVRLFLIVEALAQLELEVNACLGQLGLVGWSITFAPDRETKTGTIKRGFSVLITSPTNARPVPWSVWSGGEAQRLRIATSMGLSNLIASYTGFSPFVEVWDEPSTGMSAEGIQGLLQAFSERARSFRRQVWVVDHRALESGAFSQAVIAVKSSGTSKLEIVDHGHGE